jgi:hypothetical protein
MSGQEQGTPRVTRDLELPSDFVRPRTRTVYPTEHEQGLSISLADGAKEQRRDQNAPSEFRAALRAGVADLASMVKAARKRVKDEETSLHLNDLLFELERGH